MSSSIFREGAPHGLLRPMYDDGFAIEPGLVYPEFAAELLDELKIHGKYADEAAVLGRGPEVKHDSEILHRLHGMPRLAEYRQGLNDAITEVSGFDHEHLTYLTVRACPVERMSSNIHRNDSAAGPWLVALTVAGSGSINMYRNDVIEQDEEIVLRGNGTDPEPFVSSPMDVGGAWGIYSKEWSAPHAGGPNTSPDPKVLVLLYGWYALDRYPHKNQAAD